MIKSLPDEALSHNARDILGMLSKLMVIFMIMPTAFFGVLEVFHMVVTMAGIVIDPPLFITSLPHTFGVLGISMLVAATGFVLVGALPLCKSMSVTRLIALSVVTFSGTVVVCSFLWGQFVAYADFLEGYAQPKGIMATWYAIFDLLASVNVMAAFSMVGIFLLAISSSALTHLFNRVGVAKRKP